MEAAGRYNLNWTDFDKYTRNAFKGLSQRKEFVDVTLACESGEVQAHKVILAAGSTFFRSMLLRMSSHPHPMIYLENIGTEQLEAMVAFMYTGETTVPHDTFDDFMRSAKRYEVVGLMEPEREEGVKQEQLVVQDQDGGQVSLRTIKIENRSRAVVKVESEPEDDGIAEPEDDGIAEEFLTEVDEEIEEPKEEEEFELDGEQVDESDVLCKGEIVPEMAIEMEDGGEDGDEEEEVEEEMPGPDVSNLFLPGICNNITSDGEILPEDTQEFDEMQLEYLEDDEAEEEEAEVDDDEDIFDDDDYEEDDDTSRDPDYKAEDDDEEESCLLRDVVTKTEPLDDYPENIVIQTEDLTKVLIKSETPVNDLCSNSIMNIQQKRSKKRSYH